MTATLTNVGLLEAVAIALGCINGAVLLIRPIARIHTRLDLQDAALASISRTLDRLEAKVYDDDT